MNTFTKAMESLRDQCDTAFDFRMSEVNRLRSQTQAFVKGTREKFDAMAKALHGKLEGDESARRKMEHLQAGERAGEAQRRHAGKRQQLHELHEDFAGGSRAFHKR